LKVACPVDTRAFVVTNQAELISCTDIHILLRLLLDFFHNSLQPADQKQLCGNKMAYAIYSCSRNTAVGLPHRDKSDHLPCTSGFQLGLVMSQSGGISSTTSTQVLPKLFDGRSAKKAVAVVDFEYNETRFEDDDMGINRIVLGTVNSAMSNPSEPSTRIG